MRLVLRYSGGRNATGCAVLQLVRPCVVKPRTYRRKVHRPSRKAECVEMRPLGLERGSAPFHDRRCCPEGPYLNCGKRMERPASRSGTSWGGKPADNGPDLRASPGEKGQILRPMLTRETCVSVVTRRRGKWLLPLSQNGMAAGLLGS